MFHPGKRYYIGSLIFFISGIILISLGAARGNVTGGLFFVVPFLVVTGALSGVGVVLILLAFIFLQFGLFHRTNTGLSGRVDTATSESRLQVENMRANIPFPGTEIGRRGTRRVGGGGIIFIGPIPIVFGDSRSMRYLLPGAIILFILLIIAAILF